MELMLSRTISSISINLAALDYVDITDVAKYEGKDSSLNSIKDFISRGALGPFVPSLRRRLPPTR